MKRIIIMSIITSILNIFSCSAQDFKSVEVDEFEQIIADTTILRLDVRTPQEYADGHLPGTLNIDVLAPDFEQKACAQLPSQSTIALYCRSGRRSKKAATILSKHGYTIIELNTGFLGWTSANKPTVK